MKNKTSIILIAIAIIFVSVNVSTDVWYFNTLPANVNYSAEIPQAFNATAFTFTSNIYDPWVLTSSSNINGRSISTPTSFPYTINDTQRVGNTYTIIVTYYIENTTLPMLHGLNVKEGPYSAIGTASYTIVVSELNDNRVSTYDGGFYSALLFPEIFQVLFLGLAWLYWEPKEE